MINLVNKIKKTGSGERKKGSGRRATTATSENEVLVEELICSQVEHPDTHYSITEITLALSISKTSVHCMVKRKGFRPYKHLTTLHRTNSSRLGSAIQELSSN